MKIARPLLAAVLLAISSGGAAVANGGERPVAVNHPDLPALGPYSQAVIADGLVFLSGVIAFDPKAGAIVGGGIEVQTRQVFSNIKLVLAEAGASLADVVKTTVFLKNPEDFPAMNAVYETYFPAFKPARTTVPGVNWGKGILIEVEVVAHAPGK